MSLLIFSLVCFGMVNIITMSQLFKSTRELIGRISTKAGKFMRCPMCVGYWTGLFWSVLGLGVVNRSFDIFSLSFSGGWLQLLVSIFADACISSGISWLLYVACCYVAGPEYEKL